jgi:hypothetical protein
MSKFAEQNVLWPLYCAALNQQQYQRQQAALSVMGAPGRNPKYSGILLRPMATQIGDILKARGRPGWYAGDENAWATDVETIVDREKEEWRKRDDAIFAYYGISLNGEPDGKDCWHRLALALLTAHVPGFAIASVLHTRPPKRGATPALNREQTVRLAQLVHEAITGRWERPDAIARFVCAKKDKALSVRARKQSNPKPLSQSTASILVKQMRAAWRDVCAGNNATAFQFQVVNLAIARRSCLGCLGRDFPRHIVWTIIEQPFI